jgi:SAM-dependent methyltransferase/predicted  nucleic acid-binding Zn-ribbon protein
MAELPTLRASIALAAYAEPLAEGRRVVVFGDALTSLADHLLERGARVVQVYDRDPGRVAQAAALNRSRNVTYASWNDAELAIRDGAFDLAIVENLAQLPAPGTVLRRVKRTLGPRGAALIASPNPEAESRLLPEQPEGNLLEYYALYDLVAERFEHVWMLGQAPFVGYAIAAFAPEGEPTPSFDTGFVPGGAEEVEWFVALASQRSLEFDEFSVIQLPLAWALGAMRSSSPAVARAPSPGRGEDEAVSTVREPRPSAGAALRAAGAAHSAEVQALQRELQERERWITELEDRATTADGRADQVQSELEEASAALTAAQEQARAAEQRASKLEDRAQKAQARAAEARAELKTLRAERDSLARELGEVRAELASGDGQAKPLQEKLEQYENRLASLAGVEQQAAEDVASLERQLQERAEKIQQLERDLVESGRVGRELLAQLEDRGGPDLAAQELARKLDALATLNAQREGDLAACRYHVQQLQAELGEEQSQARQQLDELREQLRSAQARLQQQAALLEQAGSGVGPESIDTA